MEQEKKVLQLLSEAWNEFLKLEKQHPDEITNFCEGIHKCQLIIGMRFARESNPEIFPKKITESEWDVWPGWGGNHDQRIEDATCKNCRYVYPKTVYGSLSKLPKECPSCHSIMTNAK